MSEDKKYYLEDIESGHRYPVSKAQYDSYWEMWDSFMPKHIPSTGSIIMCGTRGDLDSKDFDNFEKLWREL